MLLQLPDLDYRGDQLWAVVAGARSSGGKPLVLVSHPAHTGVMVKVDESLRFELMRRRDVDLTRGRWLRDAVADDGHTGELSMEQSRAWMAVDEDNTAWLRRLVADRGWPGSSLVEEDGAHAAWLLVMHAFDDRQLQRECLQHLGAAVRAGEAAAQDWAALLDRVLLADGRAQLYGTQLATEAGEYRLEPLHAPDSVDTLRAQVGLEPVQAYLTEMTSEHPPLQVKSAAA